MIAIAFLAGSFLGFVIGALIAVAAHADATQWTPRRVARYERDMGAAPLSRN